MNRRTETDSQQLTTREAAVAALVGSAMTNQQIANRLHISPHTVNYHLRQIYRKLAIQSRVRLAQLVQSGLSTAAGQTVPADPATESWPR